MKISPSSLVLTYNARCLRDGEDIGSSGIQDLASLSASLRMVGGGGNMSDNDREMAMKYRNIAKVCRKCYVKLPILATSCRKPECRSRNLRLKKLKKDVKKQ
jgi:ribosomal protein L40E